MMDCPYCEVKMTHVDYDRNVCDHCGRMYEVLTITDDKIDADGRAIII